MLGLYGNMKKLIWGSQGFEFLKAIQVGIRLGDMCGMLRTWCIGICERESNKSSYTLF
jgi:hypothetical protein